MSTAECRGLRPGIDIHLCTKRRNGAQVGRIEQAQTEGPGERTERRVKKSTIASKKHRGACCCRRNGAKTK